MRSELIESEKLRFAALGSSFPFNQNVLMPIRRRPLIAAAIE